MILFDVVFACLISLICHRKWTEAASGHSEAFVVHLEEETGKDRSI
jgi:hypothetical protein